MISNTIIFIGSDLIVRLRLFFFQSTKKQKAAGVGGRSRRVHPTRKRLHPRELRLEEVGQLFEVLGGAEEADLAALSGADPGAGEADDAA